MQLNIIIECAKLWIGVSLCTILYYLYRNIEGKKLRQDQILYIKRVLYYMPKCSNGNQLLLEVYYSLGKDKRLKKYILQGIKRQEKATNDKDYIQSGFDYIEKKIGCEPISYIHRNIIDEELKFGEYKLFDYEELRNEAMIKIAEWDNCGKLISRQFKRQRLKNIIAQILFLIMNSIAFVRLHTDISMYVLVIVHTIGIMSFICLHYDTGVVECKKRDGNLARDFCNTKMALATCKRINSFYQLAGGMGLIVHLWYFTTQQLEQVI